jgi:hypothetical protein
MEHSLTPLLIVQTKRRKRGETNICRPMPIKQTIHRMPLEVEFAVKLKIRLIRPSLPDIFICTFRLAHTSTFTSRIMPYISQELMSSQQGLSRRDLQFSLPSPHRPSSGRSSQETSMILICIAFRIIFFSIGWILKVRRSFFNPSSSFSMRSPL